MTKTKDPLGDEHFRTCDAALRRYMAWCFETPVHILFGVPK